MVDDFILFKIQTQNYISSRENATLWLKNLILDFLNQDFRAPRTAREIMYMLIRSTQKYSNQPYKSLLKRPGPCDILE